MGEACSLTEQRTGKTQDRRRVPQKGATVQERPGLHPRPTLWPGCPSNCPHPERPPTNGGLLRTGEEPRACGRLQDPAECPPFPGMHHGTMSLPSLQALEDAAHLRGTNEPSSAQAWAPVGAKRTHAPEGHGWGLLVCAVPGCGVFPTRSLLETHRYLDLHGLRAPSGKEALGTVAPSHHPKHGMVSACSVRWTETDGRQGERCTRTFRPMTRGARSPTRSSREGRKGAG